MRSEDAVCGDSANVPHGRGPLHALPGLGGDSPARPFALALFIQRADGFTISHVACSFRLSQCSTSEESARAPARCPDRSERERPCRTSRMAIPRAECGVAPRTAPAGSPSTLAWTHRRQASRARGCRSCAGLRAEMRDGRSDVEQGVRGYGNPLRVLRSCLTFLGGFPPLNASVGTTHRV